MKKVTFFRRDEARVVVAVVESCIYALEKEPENLKCALTVVVVKVGRIQHAFGDFDAIFVGSRPPVLGQVG